MVVVLVAVAAATVVVVRVIAVVAEAAVQSIHCIPVVSFNYSILATQINQDYRLTQSPNNVFKHQIKL